MNLLTALKNAKDGRVLSVLQPGATVKLECGRTVRIKRLNLRKALTILALITQILERIGWEDLSKKSLVQAIFEALTVGQSEFVQILELLTDETCDILEREMTPSDTIRVLITALNQEFAHFPKSEVKML